MRFPWRSVGTPQYATWAEATAACAEGYQNPHLLEVIHEKTRRYRDELESGLLELNPVDVRISLGLSLAATTPNLRVLDFGGACGAHYFLARKLLSGSHLQWCVVETTRMAARAADFEDGSLSFTDSVPSAVGRLGSVDLVLSSGTLHYLPNPRAVLESLLACKAKTLLLTRLALTDGPDLITVQRSMLADNGRGPMPPGIANKRVSYPAIFVNRDDIEHLIESRYRFRARLVEERAVHFVGRQAIDHIGYLAEIGGS
jgi:putative methyltransferase (TIGR04325 family)